MVSALPVVAFLGWGVGGGGRVKDVQSFELKVWSPERGEEDGGGEGCWTGHPRG